MMSKSGTFRNRHEGTPYYTPEMLITRVSENLTLPPLKRVSVTRDGRIMNRAKDGLCELYIGLYHKEGNEWKLASNVVQVRGRSEDKTQLWEFDAENIVTVENE